MSEITFDQAVRYSLETLGSPHLSLKKEQYQALKAIYDRRDVFVCLPTGFGKSLCYQTAPFVMDYKLGHLGTQKRSAVVVVSPLVSLMVDQVQSLRRRGVKSSIMSSSSTIAQDLLASDLNMDVDSLLYASPEALATSHWRDALEKQASSKRIVAVVVDEAHCVSKWYVLALLKLGCEQ